MDDALDHAGTTHEQRTLARDLWRSTEVLHAVTYFDPQAVRAVTEAGAKGFWMSYFATRLAPLGPVGPELATAVCFGFSPGRPRRALPDAWSYLSPEEALRVRSEASAAALRRLTPGLEDDPGALDATVGSLARLVGGLDPAGRPLGGANLGVPLPEDPVARLWQLCTTLREHRGDGHVALLVAHGLDGCSANVLATAVKDQDPEVLRTARSWDLGAWRTAAQHLAARGLTSSPDTSDGSVRVAPTEAGRSLLGGIEAATDALAWHSYRATFDEPGLQALRDGLAGWARTVFDAGLLPQPNPIGLTPPAG